MILKTESIQKAFPIHLEKALEENLENSPVGVDVLNQVSKDIQSELSQSSHQWVILDIPVAESEWAIIIFLNVALKKEFHIRLVADNDKQELRLDYLYYDEDCTDVKAETLKEAYEKNVNVFE